MYICLGAAIPFGDHPTAGLVEQAHFAGHRLAGAVDQLEQEPPRVRVERILRAVAVREIDSEVDRAHLLADVELVVTDVVALIAVESLLTACDVLVVAPR